LKGEAFDLRGNDESIARDHRERHWESDAGRAVEQDDVEWGLDHSQRVAKPFPESLHLGEAERFILITECYASRDEMQVGGRPGADRLLDVHPLHQHVPEVKALILGSPCEGERCARLRVHIHDQVR
jgi:hypothetical protein